MDYEISFNLTEGGFRIPLNPASMEVKESGQSKSYDISKLGEINVLRNPKLATFGFESIFPANDYPYTVVEPLEPVKYVETFERWMKLKKLVRFVFAGSSFELNTLVSIESFTWGEVGGAVGDIEYKISLKTYVPYAARKIPLRQSNGQTVKVSSANQPVRPDNREQPKTYTLVAGDNLWKVAQKFLGNGARYKEIQKLNNITDAELTRLQIGRVIKLP